MGRTITSFRLSSLIEEQEWKSSFVKYLDKNDTLDFRNMFALSILYNSACSYSTKPMRLYPILYSIVFHQYKILKKKIDTMNNNTIDYSQKNKVNDIKPITTSQTIFPYSDIVTKEIHSWEGYAKCLRKEDRKLFYQMLSECYKYSESIHVKGKDHSINSVLMSILFENYKKIQMLDKTCLKK